MSWRTISIVIATMCLALTLSFWGAVFCQTSAAWQWTGMTMVGFIEECMR